MPTVTSPLAAPAVSRAPVPSGVVMPRNDTDALPSEDASRPGTKFIRGEPIKPATNMFAGLSYSVSGASTCCRRPAFRTAIRSPIVIASTWSCVTYTVVTRKRW